MSDKREQLIKLVKDYVEPIEMLGWKESYLNVMEDILNGEDSYSEELSAITEKELIEMRDFWQEESLLKDYIKTGITRYDGDNKGKLTLFFWEQEKCQ